MKKLMMMAAVCCMVLTACEKPIASEDEAVGEPTGTVATKKFTFTVKGAFSISAFDDVTTRGTLTDNEENMTDLWVFDYVDGKLVQQLHQVPTDDDWGKPVLTLAHGTHHVYFVASRGDDATVTTISHKITWVTPRDAFWKDYEVNVTSTSNGNRSVTLDRVATRFRVTVTDEVPANVAAVTVTPETWYYGLDYLYGIGVDPSTNKVKTVSVPSSYIGTTGTLTLNIYGLSSTEWTTDVTVTSKDGDGNVIGTVTLEDVPFKQNRSTDYSGPLFGSTNSADISLDSEWSDAYTGTW